MGREMNVNREWSMVNEWSFTVRSDAPDFIGSSVLLFVCSSVLLSAHAMACRYTFFLSVLCLLLIACCLLTSPAGRMLIHNAKFSSNSRYLWPEAGLGH